MQNYVTDISNILPFPAFVILMTLAMCAIVITADNKR